MLMYGREPRLPLDIFLGNLPPAKSSAVDHVQRHLQRIQSLRQLAREKAQRDRDRDSAQKEQRGDHLQVGDLVLMKQHLPGRNKISDKYKASPMKVIAIPNELQGYYTLQLDDGRTVNVSAPNIRRYTPAAPLGPIAETPDVPVPLQIPIPADQPAPEPTSIWDRISPWNGLGLRRSTRPHKARQILDL